MQKLTSHTDRQADALSDALPQVFGFDGINRISRSLEHFDEQWKNRVVVESLNWAEQYVDGRGDLAFYFERGSRPNGASDSAVSDCHTRIDERIAVFIDNPFRKNLGNAADDYDFLVLVNVRQSANTPECFSVPAFARLYIVEQDGFDLGEGVLYRGLLNRIYKVVPRFVHREVDAVIGINVFSDDLAGNVIQRGAQPANHFANYAGKLQWNRFSGDAKSMIPGVININGDGADVGLWKLGGVELKLLDVVFGPLSL